VEGLSLELLLAAVVAVAVTGAVIGAVVGGTAVGAGVACVTLVLGVLVLLISLVGVEAEAEIGDEDEVVLSLVFSDVFDFFFFSSCALWVKKSEASIRLLNPWYTTALSSSSLSYPSI